jgi:hypothetical protein
VEARLKEYIEAIEHIPRAKKKEWAVARLGRSIETAYRTGDKVMIFTVRFPEDEIELRLTYTPVTKRLQEIAQRLGDFLHAPRTTCELGPDWWSELRCLLNESYPLLKLATAGELVGLPLLHRPTGRLNMRVALDGDDPRYALLARLAEGKQYKLSVEYIDPVPGTFS